MGKPLAGKKAFEAMGRRACSIGLPLNAYRSHRISWPTWAREAWARGWIVQRPYQVAQHNVKEQS
jgi:hypothetical protein